MSAFLGPIHHTMYARVLTQDEMSEALLAETERNGWTDGLRASVDANTPAATGEPLEGIIDTANIHGWLSALVANSESRFAEIAEPLLRDHPERMGAMAAALYALGEKHQLENTQNTKQVFDGLSLLLLDGMPCDRPFDDMTEEGTSFSWSVRACPHEPYWQASSLGTKPYYQLRKAFVDGVLHDTKFQYMQKEPDVFAIEPKE